MKTYKIAPDSLFFVLGFLISALTAVISFSPITFFENTDGLPSRLLRILMVIVFLLTAILVFILSVIYGKIKEIETKEDKKQDE